MPPRNRQPSLDVDTRRLRYRYQPQADPVIEAQRAAYLAGATIPEVGPKTEREDATIGNELLLRGIPVNGYGGAIRGTRPGDPVKYLEM